MKMFPDFFSTFYFHFHPAAPKPEVISQKTKKSLHYYLFLSPLHIIFHLDLYFFFPAQRLW